MKEGRYPFSILPHGMSVGPQQVGETFFHLPGNFPAHPVQRCKEARNERSPVVSGPLRRLVASLVVLKPFRWGSK